jgi:hypothetical protein
MRTPKINSKKLSAAWHVTDTADPTKAAEAGQEAYPNPAPAGSSTNARATISLQWKLS